MSMNADSNAAFMQGGEHNNLFGSIDRNNVNGLNLAAPESAKELIKPWDAREDMEQYADSGVDDQMIIHVPFVEAVRLKSVLIKTSRGESAPRRMRIYANHHTIVDFADAESFKPHLDIRLLEGEAGVAEYPLRVAAFANINSLSLFFDDSSGGELTRMYYLGFKGDRRAPKKDAETTLEIPAANAADAPIVDRLAEKSGAAQTTAR